MMEVYGGQPPPSLQLIANGSQMCGSCRCKDFSPKLAVHHMQMGEIGECPNEVQERPGGVEDA